jgi:hypothetical protein
MSKKIPINTITPQPSDPNSDGYELTGYYFKAEESGLNMYGPGTPNQPNPPVKENITLGTSFPVSIPAHGNNPAITMNVTVNSYSLTVLGAWSDEAGIEGDPGSGTFQAQAGGGGAAEDDIASSAKA